MGEIMNSSLALRGILLFFPAAMALAASMDLLTMTIPNRLCAVLAIGFFVLAGLLGFPLHGVLVNLSCGAAVLGLTFGLFAFGLIGGGDAKLAAATALWLGWSKILDYGFLAAICGGALTLILLMGRRIQLPNWVIKNHWIARLHNPTSGVPYGIALAVAGIMIYPQTQVWQFLAAR
jgi:prepilin peptidase CpaA